MPTPGQELSSIDFASMLGGPLIACVDAQAQAAMSSVEFIKEVGFTKIPHPDDPNLTVMGEPVYVTFKYPKETAPYTPAKPATLVITVTDGGTGYTTAPGVSLDTSGTGASAVATINADGEVTAVTVTAPGSGYGPTPTVTFSSGAAKATAVFTEAAAAQPAQYETMKLEVPILTMLPIPYLRIEDVTIDFNAKINSVEYQRVDTSFKVDAALEVKQRWTGGSAKLNVSASYQRTTQQGSQVDRTYSLAVHIKAVQDEMPAGMEKVLGILENAMKAVPASVA